MSYKNGTKLQIAILGNEGSWYVEDLARAAQSRGHHSLRADFRRLVSHVSGEHTSVTADGINFDTIDAVIVRTMPPGTLEQVVYRMDALQALERAGKHVSNPPRAIECAVDKFLTTSRLAACGLPIPRTIVCESADQALEVFELFDRDVVVKPIFGAEGRGIIRVSDPDLAFRSLRAIERLQQVIYIQEYIHHPGYDVRVMVLDGRILGGMRRSNPADFRTNVSRNGEASAHRVTDAEAVIALAAAKAVHCKFAGIDLLYDQDGVCYVIEVNAVPGWRAFAKVNNIDVANFLVKSLENSHVHLE